MSVSPSQIQRRAPPNSLTDHLAPRRIRGYGEAPTLRSEPGEVIESKHFCDYDVDSETMSQRTQWASSR
jgi:hypothetical protein